MKIEQIVVEKNVPCRMRDGSTLYADIYRPSQEGKFPVLLTRLPYNKDLPFYSHRYLDTHRLVQHGYVVIVQDVRGRFNSEGEFYPFLYEAEDGYDTVEWAAALPYSNGKVGMFGLSYYGYTQLLAAAEQPPHLEAIVPAMTLNDWRNNSLDKGGKFLVASSETWALESVAPEYLRRKYGDSAEYAVMMEKWADTYNRIEEWYSYKPIQQWPPLKELDAAGYFFDLLEGNVTEEMGERMSILNKYKQIQVPAYHIAGWYDNLLQSTLKNFSELHKQGRGVNKLIIGPWGHGVFSSVIGERNFGLQASGDWIDGHEDLTGLHIRWFDYWLKGEHTIVEDEAPIKLFVMGVNEWRDEQEWPLARTTYVPYYLHSDGKANSRFGDGRLSVELPTKDEPKDTFVYDPSNPVPTNGGGTLYAGVQTMGPKDQRQLEERGDVLVYTSEPLAEALEVTGPVKVILWAKTDAVDTDFTAKLIDVLPDGTAFNLTDGIVRASYRNGEIQVQESYESIKDEIMQYEIELWPTSNVFLPGHQIRIEISSSNFPRFDTNLNTGHTMITSSNFNTANQTIYHQETYPSHVVLPIIK
ncbi:CocE/NonD family hydrolase [Neobacillus rhizophilus]|uniref:CocE/NonD family hydrolase n=1 Tax=Neobacillus rhizophilus TaxID=2833579 RepID=A0A942U5N5_9BACI|nr:CocE/NonD family hydrolase [Neobacillus rhizophilus]MBS4212891.1 CocE/NonD family hydrolase [Neobacillus rhizophilus]